MSEFAHLPLAQITASLTNPRKTFDPAKLAELAASITASGVHQAVLVRPLPGNRVADTDRGVLYELVTGERRLRACALANVPTIPAMIRPLTDDQVLEIQIVENLQRDDLTELEEAEGYEALMQHSRLNAEQVGEKIGKSRSYVYGRLKLLDLCQEARASLRDQCQAAGVPFFFKQWGEWNPGTVEKCLGSPSARVEPSGSAQPWQAFDPRCGDWCMYKVGKKAAGRLLDGRTWDEVPA